MNRILNHIYYELESLVRRTINFLNWRLIRAVSQLQILTRASYLMLILVPLLAGTWPAVRLYVNQHNQRAADLTSKLEEAHSRWQVASQGLGAIMNGLTATAETPEHARLRLELQANASMLTNAVNVVGTTVNAFKGDFSERTLKDPKLPWSFATAFFAALFAVIAQLVYQMFAPEIIKASTLDEFVSARKADYTNHPSDAAIERAVACLKTPSGERELDDDTYEIGRFVMRLYNTPREERARHICSLQPELLRQVSDFLEAERRKGASSKFRFMMTSKGEDDSGMRDIREQVEKALSSSNEAIEPSERERMKKMTTIERGAKAEYSNNALTRPVAILISAVFYAFAIFFLVLIIRAQATSVWTAAGWNSVRDVLR